MGTIYSWSVFRIPIEKLFNIGATESGLPYMVSLASYALFMMISGRIINIYSPRVILSLGAMLIAVGIGSLIGLMIVGMTSKVGYEMIGLSSDKITNLMLLFAVFNGLGRPIFGWLTDKLSYQKTAILSYTIIALAALLMVMG